MIVYNTTFHIEKTVWDACLAYLRQHYIPGALKSGELLNPCLRRVMLAEEAEENGVNVSVQFEVKDLDTLNVWLQREGNRLHKDLVSRFGYQVAGFSTLLEDLDWKQG